MKIEPVALLDLLLPPDCAGCGAYGSAICAGCRAKLRPPVEASDAFLVHDRAVVVGDALLVGVAAFAHRDEAQRILRRLKYGGGRHLATPLARLAAPALRQLLAICGPAVLVPVPLHAGRQRQRGYNQATLLAEALGVQQPVCRCGLVSFAAGRRSGSTALTGRCDFGTSPTRWPSAVRNRRRVGSRPPWSWWTTS